MSEIIDGAYFLKDLVFSLLLWGMGVAAFVLYAMDRNPFFDICSTHVRITLLIAWTYIGSLPLTNYYADKAQFGMLVGRAREMGLGLEDRPWYGVGGYQFLVVLIILLVGFGYSYYQHKQNYRY